MLCFSTFFCLFALILLKNGVLKGGSLIASVPVISDLLFLLQSSDAFSRDEDIARSPASLGFRLKISVES